MATISQIGVTNLTNEITIAMTEYNKDLKTTLSNFCDTINSIWCSNKSKEFGNELKTNLDTFNTAFDTKFEEINEVLKSNIANHNEQNGYDSHVNYNGITFCSPNTGNLDNLNDSLSGVNGDEKGLAEGHSLEELYSPIESIEYCVRVFCAAVSGAIAKADAFSGAEQRELATAIDRIRQTFINAMETLKNNYNIKLSEEQSSHEAMSSSNQENLESLTGTIDASSIDYSQIATNANDAANGNWLPNDQVNSEYWGDSTGGQLEYEQRDDGSALITEEGTPMGYTSTDALQDALDGNSGSSATGTSGHSQQYTR